MNYPELMRARIEQYIAEGRTVSGGKGDSTDQNAETSQSNFNNTLQNAFSSQFGAQSATLNYLSNTMKQNMANPQGFTAPQAAALSTQNIQGAAQATKAAQMATNNSIAAKGGSALPSGVNAQLTAQNNVAGAAMEAGGANQIAQANAQLQQQNYWKSADELNDVSQLQNPTGYAGSANAGSGALAGLSNAYSTSENAGPLNQTLDAFGSGLGGGLGKTLSGYAPTN